MKRSVLLLLSLLSAALGGCARKSFEGVIQFQMTGGGRTTTSEYAIKGDRARMEMGGEKMPMIGLFNSTTGEMHMLMPAQKTYMTISLPKEAKDAPAATSEARLEETGRTEEIAGYRCTQFLITDKNRTQEVWATQGLGRFVAFSDSQNNRGGGSGGAWAQLLADRGLFPMRTITKDRNGKVLVTMEATKVEEKALDAALFEIPEGYKPFSMPDLGGLFKGKGP
jgi:hypothetical protein